MRNKTKDNSKLIYELIYHKYLIDSDRAYLFTEIKQSDYIALHMLDSSTTEGGESDRIYLSDIAQMMDISIFKASKQVRKLKDRGLVRWSHDGAGDEGTYVTITPSGRELMQRQKEILDGYYSRVISRYGADNLWQLLELMDGLEKIMHEESAQEKGEIDDRGENL